jgi:SEC-C motif
MVIEKSIGQTPTEQYLSHLCDQTFLRLWSYANPFKADGKELCDLIAVFENNVFLFFDRESRKFDHDDDVLLTWERWKKEAITKQIQTAAGAKRYVLNHRDQIYLDANTTVRLPLHIPEDELRIHKVIVAHGAKEACKKFSSNNIYGSLGISYGTKLSDPSLPFIVSLERSDPVHLLDSHNLELILGELDTLYDLQAYLTAKEDAIRRYTYLQYCGEEDLLAHYFLNFDDVSKNYMIGLKEDGYDGLMIGEGEWRDFIESGPYKRRKSANHISYQWDRLIQKTGQNALKDVLGGNSDVFRGKSAIHEMAKEPRLSRRSLSEMMATAIKNFPDSAQGIVRSLSFMPSFFPGVGYIFLQLFHENPGDYDAEYRPTRQLLLEFSCGAAKLKWPQLTKIIGIAIDAPKYSQINSEDFILFDCENWTNTDQAHYEEVNAELHLFQTSALKERRIHATEFPSAQKPQNVPKIGRNQLCPCGSGKKFKRCHGQPT